MTQAKKTEISRWVWSVDDFSVLKRIAFADRLGCLIASAVNVNCSLLDQPYDEVVGVMEVLRSSSVEYDFANASTFFVNDQEDWKKIHNKMRVGPVKKGYEYHIYSSIVMDDSSFADLRVFLKEHRCLLLGAPPKKPQCASLNAEIDLARSARLH